MWVTQQEEYMSSRILIVLLENKYCLLFLEYIK